MNLVQRLACGTVGLTLIASGPACSMLSRDKNFKEVTYEPYRSALRDNWQSQRESTVDRYELKDLALLALDKFGGLQEAEQIAYELSKTPDAIEEAAKVFSACQSYRENHNLLGSK